MRQKFDHRCHLIAQRATAYAAANRLTLDVDSDQLAVMIAFVHEWMPLRLQDFLEADDYNFVHDAFGIYRHYTPDGLNQNFRPRFCQH